jgi:hypothetical protein
MKGTEGKIVEKTYPPGLERKLKAASAGYCYPRDNTKGKH